MDQLNSQSLQPNLTFSPAFLFHLASGLNSRSRTMVDPKLKYPTSQHLLKIGFSEMAILPTFKAPIMTIPKYLKLWLPGVIYVQCMTLLAFRSQTSPPFFMIDFTLTGFKSPSTFLTDQTIISQGAWNLWQFPGFRYRITWQSQVSLFNFSLSIMSFSIVFEVPSKRREFSEQVMSLMITLLSPVILEMVRIWPSHGLAMDFRFLLYSSMQSLFLIVRVKNQLKFGYQAKDLFISSKSTPQRLAYLPQTKFLREEGTVIVDKQSVVFDIKELIDSDPRSVVPIYNEIAPRQKRDEPKKNIVFRFLFIF